MSQDGGNLVQPSGRLEIRQQDQLTAMDFLKGVRYDKGYIEPLIDDFNGIGDKFSPLYYVDAVAHSFTAIGYRQNFKVERNSTE